MRKIHQLTVLSLFLLVPASITWAQTVTQQKGLIISEFSLPHGSIKTYLPADIRPGDEISGLIVTLANGKNAKQVQKNLDELKKHFIVFGGKKFSVPETDTPFSLAVNPDSQLEQPLGLAEANGRILQQVNVRSISPEQQRPPPQKCIIPRHAMTGSPLVIPGPFDGNLSNTSVTLDTKPLMVLAESPRQMVVSYPARLKGNSVMEVREQGKNSCTQTVSSVNLNVSAGKLNLLRGQSTQLDVEITGLQNLNDTAILTVQNVTTDIVEMTPSNLVVIPLSGKTVNTGIFIQRFNILSHRTGAFIVNVDLNLPEGEYEEQLPNEPQDHPPTTTVQRQCKCEASCSVEKVVTRGAKVTFKAIVKASCTGDCSLVRITYKWHIGESGKDVAAIVGPSHNNSVTVRIKKGGSYNLYLNGTVFCTIGSCDFNCNAEETAPPPYTIPNTCARDLVELSEPLMDGGLKFNDFFPAKRTIKRDDFILLGAEGADYDQLQINCEPIPECRDTRSQKMVPLSGRVRFEWKINSGGGGFVKLGCLFTNGKSDQSDEGEHVIFMPPYVPLPVILKDTFITTYLTLSVIDDKDDEMRDEQVDRSFQIITHRSKEEPGEEKDEYKIEIVYNDKHKLPAKPITTLPEGTCKASHGNWDKKTDLRKPKVILPGVADNNKMVLGQWILLMADDQHETDILKKIECVSGTNCKIEPPEEKTYEDNVQWEWEAKNGGRFISDRLGRYVVFEVPAKLPEGKNEIEIIFRVKVFNPEGPMIKDLEQWSDPVSIKVYQPGIQVQYPAAGWLPAENNKVSITSELKYMKDKEWQPALAHMCRIHYFELLKVSEEKGICLNYPEKTKANECRDLQFKNEDQHEAYDAGKTVKKCTLTDQWLKARTQIPKKTYAVTVHSSDYGSYGFIRSSAKPASTPGLLTFAPKQYISIPWKDEDVEHVVAAMRKRTVYTDNRVTIPYDIDENQIPDKGWITLTGALVPDPGDNAGDNDEAPVGDGFRGDGFSNYEEYRGFKIRQMKKTTTGTEVVEVPEDVHIRTDHQLKNIFIRNKHGLPLDLYKKITGLQVLEISEESYQDDKIRVVNFNHTPATHVVDQKGLYLVAGDKKGILLGYAITKTGQPAVPNDVDSIVVYLTAITESVKKVNAQVDEYNNDPQKIKKWGGRFKYLKEEDKLASCVAHELCHGNLLCHHGEGDEAKAESYDKVHGLRSGNIACVMRYDNVGTRIADTTYFPEIPGTILCTSPVGTVYNAPTAKGANLIQGGFGDSSPGRGNCAGQLRVSGRAPVRRPCPR